VRIDTASGTIQCTLEVPAVQSAGVVDLGKVACGGTE
jgi:hypothetical protein